jgi:hypothetical protein
MTALLSKLVLACALCWFAAVAAFWSWSAWFQSLPKPSVTHGREFPPPPAAVTPVDQKELRPNSDYAQTLQRPLFFEGRRIPAPVAIEIAPAPPMPIQMQPPAPPPPPLAPPKPVFPVERLVLRGVAGVGAAMAAFIEVEGSQAVWVPVGGTIQGWQVAAISATGVEVVNEGRRAALDLHPRRTN